MIARGRHERCRQAEGMLAQHLGQDREVASAVLRHCSRNHNVRLTDVASALAGEVTPEDVVLGRSYPLG